MIFLRVVTRIEYDRFEISITTHAQDAAICSESEAKRIAGIRQLG